MTYSSTDNNQNQTGTNPYQIVVRLNYAALEQNYQPHHIEEFKASALDPELVLLNITNLEGDLAVSALLWGLEPTNRTNTGIARERFTRPLQHIRQGGLAFYGVDPLTGERTECLSFKPDRPLSPDRKYENPRQISPQAIYPAVTYRIWQMVSDRFNIPLPSDITLNNPASFAAGFWLWAIANNLPLIITEGLKKALSAISQGFPAVALTGLWNWTDSIKDENGKTKQHRLIDTLTAIATPERVIHIALDRDKKAATNRAVIQSRSALAKCLIDRQCSPFSIPWDADYKGLDDLIAECGVEALELAITNSETLTGEPPNFKQKPSPNSIAEKIAKELVGKVLYDVSGKMWRVYTAGVWEEKTLEEIERYFYERVCLDVPDNIPSYIDNVIRVAKWKLLIPKWEEVSGVEYIPFKNGVWDVLNHKLLPHSPDFLLTWKLPRDYPSVFGLEYRSIDNFLNQVTKSNQQLKNILIAAANAVLLGRCDLQKAIYLVGNGGNGKGSFLRLLEMLVGDMNTHSTTLHDLCDNQFEIANIYKKRLIICPDEDKRFGGLSRFKSITGGDSIRGEKKGKDAFKFRYEGMVAIASNDPIFLGDSSYGLSRRLITIPFKYQVLDDERRNLEAEFTADLPAFTSYLLSLDRDWVKSILMGSNKVASVRETEWDMTTRTDSIAGFYDDSLIFDPTAKTSTSLMYKAYQDYCKESGLSAKSIHKFTPELIELCSIKLGLKVEGHRSNKGRSIIGLRFRSESDAAWCAFRVGEPDGRASAYAGSDALKTEVSPPSNPIAEQGVLFVSFSKIDDRNESNETKVPDKNSAKIEEIPTALEEKSRATDINVTASSETELCCFSGSYYEQHQVAPTPTDDEVLPKGTKVQCERIDKEGVVYASRRKEFNKPNGTTEVVLQYYIDFGSEDYRWLDWDLVVEV
jgi:P4 family phage/plasmid primase-like protien